MENTTVKKVKIGYRYGTIMIVLGIVLVGINVAMLYLSDKYFPKLLAAGMATSFLSPIFFLFPGAPMEKMPQGKELNRVFWQNAPVLHRAMWIIWGIISVVVAMIALISFDPDFIQ